MGSEPLAPPPMSLPMKLAQAQQDLAKWMAIAAKPNLSPRAAAAAQEAARSSKAAVTLCQKAMAWEQERQEQNGDPNIKGLLGLGSSGRNPQPPPGTMSVVRSPSNPPNYLPLRTPIDDIPGLPVRIGESIRKLWIILAGVVLLIGFPVGGICASFMVGWWVMKGIFGGGFVFFSAAFLFGLFLSIYVWQPYVKPAVFAASDALFRTVH